MCQEETSWQHKQWNWQSHTNPRAENKKRFGKLCAKYAVSDGSMEYDYIMGEVSKMSNTKTPVTFTPTLNGVELGNNWIVANGLKASRPLTQEEQDVMINGLVQLVEKRGKVAVITKVGDTTTVSFEG